MKQEQIHIRVTKEEKALLLQKAGSLKLSTFLLKCALNPSSVPFLSVSPVKSEDNEEIRVVRESCESCSGRDLRFNRLTKKEECTACVKIW